LFATEILRHVNGVMARLRARLLSHEKDIAFPMSAGEPQTHLDAPRLTKSRRKIL
jgi:hypothetical protein